MPGTVLSDMGLTNEYEHLFDICRINDNKYPAIDQLLIRIATNQNRYQTVATSLNIPWYFIGIIHCMEASLNFKTHLHNGDPLTAKTTHVPAGRPANGSPPFTWEDSATDALRLRNLDKWEDWSVPGILFQFESYNGMGYRRMGINSPYLWSFSNNYGKGKFTADGVYNPNSISKQCGSAVLLRRMKEKQMVTDISTDRIALIKQVGAKVSYSSQYSEEAERLQQLLNSVGASLRVDGNAGDKTSEAYKSVSGNYLNGDPRNSQ